MSGAVHAVHLAERVICGAASALAALLLAAACGTGTDGKPVAPPTTPGPAPPPPVVRAVAEVWTWPSDARGYVVGERIWVVLRSSETTKVEGSPRLAIEIGEHVRLADFSPWVEDDFPPERPSWLQRFEYEVGRDDADADGISIQADALDGSDGSLLNAAGMEVKVAIHAVVAKRLDDPAQVAPGEPLGTHRVIGWPELRACTDQRQRALEYSWSYVRLVDEWHPDRPIRFLVDADPIIAGGLRIGRPDFLEAQVLQPLRDMARRLEERLGYAVMESPDAGPGGAGNTVSVSWRDFVYWPPWAEEQCGPLGAPWNAQGDPPAVFLNRPIFDPEAQCWPYERSRRRETIIHELAHTFGMGHAEGYSNYVAEDLAMSRELTAMIGEESDAFLLVEDLDNIGCVFPHPDLPR